MHNTNRPVKRVGSRTIAGFPAICYHVITCIRMYWEAPLKLPPHAPTHYTLSTCSQFFTQWSGLIPPILASYWLLVIPNIHPSSFLINIRLPMTETYSLYGITATNIITGSSSSASSSSSSSSCSSSSSQLLLLIFLLLFCQPSYDFSDVCVNVSHVLRGMSSFCDTGGDGSIVMDKKRDEECWWLWMMW